MAKRDCSDLAKAILDLAMNIASDPNVQNLDDVVAEIQQSFPVMQREDIVNAIVDASSNEAQKVDELAKRLAEIKRSARIEKATSEKISQIEKYLETGELPAPPKPRKVASETLTQARNTLSNLRKWLKTADPAMQKAMKEKLDSLNKRIESGDVVVEEKREGQLHDTLTALQEQIEKAKRQITDERTLKALRARVDELQGYLDTGTIPVARQRQERGTGPADMLRDIRDDLKKQISKSEPAQKARIEKQIEVLEERIKSGDFLPKAKLPELPQSKELERMAYQRDRLRREVRMAVLDLKPKNFWGKIADPFNLIRAFKTSFDLSATLRQGGFVVLGHPVQGAKAIPDMFRALVSPQESARINAEILNRENAPLGARSKLYLAPIDGSESLHRMEEAYMSSLIEKGANSNIPILKQIFQAVEASERAYLTFLNRIRADSFDTLIETLGHNGEVSQKEADAIATFVNEATGRGRIGIEQAAVGLNTVFFAPKYTASRFQLLVGHPMWGGTNATRKLIAREYARYLMGLATVIGLGLLAGADFEDDPRSADFGKLRFGKTRIDPMSGLSQATVLMSRITVAIGFQFGLTDADAFKSSVTGKTRELQADDISRFLRGKLSPTFSIPQDVIMGKNVVGEPVTPLGALLEAPVPLSFGEIYEAMVENGIAEGTALGMLSLFGMGIQTYEDKKSSYTRIK